MLIVKITGLIVMLLTTTLYAQSSKDTTDYCSCVSPGVYDKFDRSIGSATKSLKEEKEGNLGTADIRFWKEIKNGRSVYYLALSTEAALYDVPQRGITILLTKNRRISKPKQKVTIEIEKNGFVATSFISLSAQDILMLRNYGITDFELYIHRDSNPLPERFRQYFNCLVLNKGTRQ